MLAIAENDNHNDRKSEAHYFLYYTALFLLIVPPLATNASTTFYQLTGFNRALTRSNVHQMPLSLIGSLVAINAVVVFSYAIAPGIKDLNECVNNKLFPDSFIDLWNIAKEFPQLLFTGLKALFSCSRAQRDNAVNAWATLIILCNLIFYFLIINKVTYISFYPYLSKSGTMTIIILSVLGAFIANVTFVLDRFKKTLPHIFKIGRLLDTTKKKFLGFFILMLALLNIPLMTIMGKEALPLPLAIISSFFGAFVVYTITIYGLCGDTIDQLNEIEHNDNRVIDQPKRQHGNNQCCKRIFRIIFYLLLLASCLIPAVGPSYGWNEVLSHTGTPKVAILIISIFTLIVALIGKICFRSSEETITFMSTTPSLIWNAIQKLILTAPPSCLTGLFIFDFILLGSSLIFYLIFIGKISYQKKWITYHFMRFLGITMFISAVIIFISSILYFIRAIHRWHTNNDISTGQRILVVGIPTFIFISGLLLLSKVSFMLAISYLNAAYFLSDRRAYFWMATIANDCQWIIFIVGCIVAIITILGLCSERLMNYFTSRINPNFKVSEDDKEQRKCLSITLLFTGTLTVTSYPHLTTKLNTELMIGLFLISSGMCIQDIVEPKTGVILPSITIISTTLISIAGVLYCQHPIIISGENATRIPFALLIIGVTLLAMRLTIKYAKYVYDYSHQEQTDNVQPIALTSNL
jgi:hypothetical protein